MEAIHAFSVKNCSLVATATGEKASSLYELREKIAMIDEACLYYHFWGARMTAQFTFRQHHNDFASFAFHRLHDHVLAEKLSVIDPREYKNLEELRQELLETIDERLEDYEVMLSVKKDERFYFVWAIFVIFDSTYKIAHPKDFLSVIERIPPSSIFYHFIDARGRTPDKIDDFSAWLKNFGKQYEDLIAQISSIDPYFLSLVEVKNELIKAFRNYEYR